jgi:hypothetical protein
MLDPSDRERDRVRQWRLKAEELRTIADQADSAHLGDTFRRLADTYDRLANDSERRDDSDKEFSRPKTA